MWLFVFLPFLSALSHMDKTTEIPIWCARKLLSIISTKLQKTCSFLHAHYSENFLKKKTFMAKNTYLLNGHMRQFQCAPTTYLNENKEAYFEIYPYQESCPLALNL